MKKGFLALLISLCILTTVYAEEQTISEPNSEQTTQALDKATERTKIIEEINKEKQARIKELMKEFGAISQRYDSVQKLIRQLEARTVEINAIIKELGR